MDFLLVDDHPMIHETLAAVVRSLVPGARIHSEAGLAGALARARGLEQLELVLLDLGLPGYSGIEALRRFRKALPRARILIVSASRDAESARGGRDAGTVGDAPTPSAPGVPAAARPQLRAGGIYRPAVSAASREAPSMGDLGLTQRHADVLRLLARGLANGEIARQLAIAEN